MCQVKHVAWKRFAEYNINVRLYYHHHLAQHSGSRGPDLECVENKRNTMPISESSGRHWKFLEMKSGATGWGREQSAHFFFYSILPELAISTHDHPALSQREISLPKELKCAAWLFHLLISLHSFHTTSPKAQMYSKFSHLIINIKGNKTGCFPLICSTFHPSVYPIVYPSIIYLSIHVCCAY